MQKNSKYLVSAILIALGSTTSYAQGQDTGFVANAEAMLLHDDNIFRTSDEFAESDSLISLSPELQLVGLMGKHRFQIRYAGSYAKYADLSDADYDDHTISARADFDHTLRFKTRVEAAYIDEHQEPGTINLVQLDLSEYNKYNETRYGATAFYGNDDSIGQLEFGYRYTDLDYTNNDFDFLDQNRDQLSAKFSYRVAPKTKAYVKAVYIGADFTPPEGFVEQDNTNTSLLAGVSWNFANKLTGDINAGYQKVTFDNQDFRSTSGLAYDGTITWLISSFTKLDFKASRQALDSTIAGLGSYNQTSLSSSLTHGFTTRLTFEGAIKYYENDLDQLDVRNDKRYSYEARLMYEVTRTVTVGASYAHQNRNSTQASAEYEANAFGIQVTVDFN